MPIMTDVWAGERSTIPPIVPIMRGETRMVSIDLNDSIEVGEIIQNGTVAAETYFYRTGITVDPSPISGLLGYNISTKIAGVDIIGDNVPRDEPVVLSFTFQVTTTSGHLETRASAVVLDREI